MLFMIRGQDVENAADIRERKKRAHLLWVEQYLDRIRVAGPLLDDHGRMVGSLFVVEADDSSAAENLIGEDPYYRAGLWKRIEIQQFMAAAGTWLGGTCW